jgi:hypothetical protein
MAYTCNPSYLGLEFKQQYCKKNPKNKKPSKPALFLVSWFLAYTLPLLHAANLLSISPPPGCDEGALSKALAP